MSSHHLQVTRTARYYLAGPETGPVRTLWIALHGHAMLGARFVRVMEPLADRHTLVAVPEALSRFYLETGRDGRHSHMIGATWMTREDRTAEIRDTTAYLDLLLQTLGPRLAPGGHVGVLGFSQGAATAARWIEHGSVHPFHTVIWGVPLPPDSVVGLGTRLRERELTLVAGREDPLAPLETLETQVRELAAAGVWARVERFDGGHEIPAEVLRRVGAGAA